MTDVTPHPAPAKRRRSAADRAACRAKIAAEGCCRLCGRVPSGHHLDSLNPAHLLRGAYREWDPDGVIPLCGSGTTGCHADVDANLGDARARLRLVLDPDEVAYINHVRPGMLDVLYPYPKGSS